MSKGLYGLLFLLLMSLLCRLFSSFLVLNTAYSSFAPSTPNYRRYVKVCWIFTVWQKRIVTLNKWVTNDDETVTGTPVCQCQRVCMGYCFSVNFFALILKEKYLWDPQNIEHSFMLSRRWLVTIYNWSKFLMKNCLIYADKRNKLICSCFVLTGTSWMFLSTSWFRFGTEFLQKQPVRL